MTRRFAEPVVPLKFSPIVQGNGGANDREWMTVSSSRHSTVKEGLKQRAAKTKGTGKHLNQVSRLDLLLIVDDLLQNCQKMP